MDQVYRSYKENPRRAWQGISEGMKFGHVKYCLHYRGRWQTGPTFAEAIASALSALPCEAVGGQTFRLTVQGIAPQHVGGRMPVLLLVHKTNLTQNSRTISPAISQYYQTLIRKSRPADAISVAIQHINHIRASGAPIRDAMAAIDQPCDPQGGWDAVTWAYARAYEGVRAS